MITEFVPRIFLHKGQFPDQYVQLSQRSRTEGMEKGFRKYGAKWNEILFPSEEKIRILGVPDLQFYSEMPRVIIFTTPYHWCDLQAHRQVQPKVTYGEDDDRRYWENAVALTANALIETDDGKLVFHRKKGGARQGSIHTFGGYVLPADVKDGDISSALARELGEDTEIGLKPDEMKIEVYFGTPDGMPAILWDYGTGAVYAVVKTGLSSTDLQQRFEGEERAESLIRELFMVPAGDVEMLGSLEDVHPQTSLVVPTIMSIYGK